MRFIRAISTYKPAKANWRTTISAGELPATNRKGYDEMSEAKPQDGSTVKGYRPYQNARSLYVGLPRRGAS
jgi:hypothetical protein